VTLKFSARAKLVALRSVCFIKVISLALKAWHATLKYKSESEN